MQKLLNDALLRNLIAVGEVDILVGVPTQNHQATIGPVVHAIVDAFSGPFVRQRTVLLNVDADSTDRTSDFIQNAVPSADLVSAGYALRTIHRISAPYHGIADRATALRILLTAAELLRARAIVILDPTADPIDSNDVAALIRPVLAGNADYVKPVLTRAPTDGPLISQLVRPLFRAAYGHRLHEPIDPQFSCSGRIATSALASSFWSDPQAEFGIDLNLSAHAVAQGARLLQVATESRAHVHPDRRPGTAQVFQQIVGSMLSCLAQTPGIWTKLQGSQPVPIEGQLTAPLAAPHFDMESMEETFRTGVESLSGLLEQLLGHSLSERLRAQARALDLSFEDSLWAETVFECVAVALRGTASPTQIAQMLETLYLGRVAWFLKTEATRAQRATSSQALVAGNQTDSVESLALAFEEQKSSLVARLQQREKPEWQKN